MAGSPAASGHHDHSDALHKSIVMLGQKISHRLCVKARFSICTGFALTLENRIFPSQRNADAAAKKAALRLWPRLLQRIDTATDEGKELAARLSDWAVLVTAVDDESEPLLRSVAPYVAEGHHAWEFIRAIERISSEQPVKAFELWKLILDDGLPNYPEEVVHAAIANIARSKPDGLQHAKQIVSRYLRAGARDTAKSLQSQIDSTLGKP
jgi:hypothetical protein